MQHLTPALRHTDLTRYAGYLFDVDGVLWVDDRVIPGAAATLTELRRQGKRLSFVTNNSGQSHAECMAKFARLGLPVRDHELFVGSEITARHLARIQPGAVTHVLGSPTLLALLRAAGLDARPVTDPGSADVLVVGMDRDVNITKLTYAARSVRAGAYFVAVNTDATVPKADGLMPGAGALVAAVTTAAGREPDLVVGKPGTLLLEMALADTGLSVDECVMVGDSLAIDVAAAKALGMAAVLVLTGNNQREDVCADLQPDWIFSSVVDLV